MKPLIWAHRGYAVRYPENSLPAFFDAYHAGAHGIEHNARAFPFLGDS
ncbi:glycerophosphodiester phosphodiesterase family protein, partial [Sulfobacillus thermosulfidooxidans]